MGKVNARNQQILQMLKQKGKLSAKEIAEQFAISLPTVRRLCRALAEDGLAIRTRGGIHYMPEHRQPYSYNLKSREYNHEKVRIAHHACDLLENGNVIFLESGTTIAHFAECLAERLREGKLEDIMVFTNSLINLEILYPFCGVNMIGGFFRSERKDFAGIIGERALKGLSFDHCFIGADAISLADGVMATDIDTVRVDELLTVRSRSSVILADSTKFSKFSLISYASVRDVSMIITDTNLPDEIYREYKNEGIDIVRI